MDTDLELQDLYQELIIDHGTSPRNCRRLTSITHQAEGHNPLCGDEVQVFLKVNDNKIEEVSFQGKGCAISTASASIMTEMLLGKNIEEAAALFENFTCMITEKAINNDLKTKTDLGKLTALSGVRAYPMRVKCATLCWHALTAALIPKKTKEEEREAEHE